MANYYPKKPNVMNRALEVQKLSIPLLITHSATSTAVVVANDEPSILFLNTQGITQISIAAGALGASEVAPSLASATDSTGVINLCLVIGEVLVKVMHAEVISRALNGSPIIKPCQILAFSTGAGVDGLVGADIFLNCTTGVNFTTTDLDACLVIEYITQE